MLEPFRQTTAHVVGAALLAVILAPGGVAAQGAVVADAASYNGPIVVPASGTSGPASVYPAQVTISGQARPIGRLAVRVYAVSHGFASDLALLLVGPGGQTALLMANVGGNVPSDRVFLTFEDGAPPLSNDPLRSGTYAPTASESILGDPAFPAPAPAGPYGRTLSVFEGTDPNGTWSLYAVDQFDDDTGQFYGFSLDVTPEFGTTPNLRVPPTGTSGTTESAIQLSGVGGPITKVTASLYLPHSFSSDLDIYLIGPDGTTVELSTDNGILSSAYGTSCTPTGRTTFDDTADGVLGGYGGPFVGRYRPEGSLAAFNGKGADGTWTLRVIDDSEFDAGTLVCWSLAVTTDDSGLVQPPTALRVSSLSGNVVTFDWLPSPFGPPPTAFVFEGGAAPGQVLASIPTAMAPPTLSLSVPTGSFFTRVRTVAGGQVSPPSNELPIHVNVPVPPTPPTNLLITRNFVNLALSWRNTFGGAAPTGLVLDVSGAIETSVPLPPGESFAFSGVPEGTYTFRLRAVNAVGSSAPSAAVTQTFPGPCSGVPRPPANFQATRAGSTIFVSWDTPESGGAVTSYILNVGGSLVASLRTPQRGLSGAVAPGTYLLSVAAMNACGIGTFTPAQAITIP